MSDAAEGFSEQHPALDPNRRSRRAEGDVKRRDWHRRVVDRSLRSASQRSIDRGANLVRAATTLIQRDEGARFTVQDVADEAGQSLRTLYQYFESKEDLLLAVFEEAMRTYAALLEEAIAGLDDPVERLAGALLAAQRMPERSGPRITRGLTGLRLQLVQADPDLVARSQAPVASLVQELVETAANVEDPEAMTFLLLSLNEAAITTRALANGDGTPQPGPTDVVVFGLQGLGVAADPAWLAAVEKNLRLPKELAR